MTPRPPLWQCCLQGHTGGPRQGPAGTQLWSASHAWTLELHCLHIEMRLNFDELRTKEAESLCLTSACMELWATNAERCCLCSGQMHGPTYLASILVHEAFSAV